MQLTRWESVSYFTQIYCFQLAFQYQTLCFLIEQVFSLSVYTILAMQYPETLQSTVPPPGGRKVPLFPSAHGGNPRWSSAGKGERAERSPFQVQMLKQLYWLLHIQVWYLTSSHSSSVPGSNCSRSALNKLKRLKRSAIAVIEVTCVPTSSLKQTFWLKQIWRNHHLPC